jgi:muramoyltetrapeptide carboxypeptidase LdcA involved in peptidoglycan recycling
MDLIKPPRLRHGDLIGIASPSFGAIGMFPHRYELGKAYLESLGFRVRTARHALGVSGYVSGTPEERAADIHELFADPEVRAIVAGIGGDHSCHLLPLLDDDLIRANPKIFMGMSDITVLNVAIHVRTGLVTFSGPTLAFVLAEYPRPHALTEQSMLAALTRPEAIGDLPAATEYTDEFLDWGTRADLARARAMKPAPGWTWLKPGIATGRLLGGCLESLQHLRGTPWWPDFNGAILFLETSEDQPAPETVDALLMDFENMAVFDRIAGLLFANPYGYDAEGRQALRDVILQRTLRFSFPIVTDMDFGHTTPMLTLPLGCLARIDSQAGRVTILEPAVR